MSRFAWSSLAAVFLLCLAAPGRAQNLTVYDDALQNGFADWSYGGGTIFASTGTVHSGADAISFNQSSYSSAISFAHPGGSFTVAQYPTLHFWVHGGAAGNQKLQVVLQLTGAVNPVASAALDTYISGGGIAAGTWREVTVNFASAPLSYSGSFDRIDLEGNVASPQPILYVDDVSLVPPASGPANAIQIEHDVLVGPSTPLTSDRFTWQDGSAQPRVAVLAHHATSVAFPAGYPTNYGGSLREFRYQVGATTRVCDVTTYGNGGYGGFGYLVSHRGDGSAGGIGDDSPLGYSFPVSYQRLFEGRHHVIFRFTQLYPRYSSTTASPPNTLYNVPVTIDWVFSTGRDNPLWAVTWDLSGVPADALNDDSRAPYGELNIDGAGAIDIDGVAWGDRYKFTSTSAPVTLDSSWTWTAPNTVPWVKEWIASTDATMGIVQSQTLAQHDAGGGRNPFYHDIRRYWTHVSTDVFAPRASYSMPWSDNWPYQANEFSIGQGVSNNNARLTWGAQYGFLGQQGYTTYNGLVTSAAGHPKQSYSTYVVLGPHTAGPVEAQVAQVETVQFLVLTAATGSVVTAGPAGTARADTVTYAPAGYNHVYGALAFTASGNALDANIAVGSGTLRKPLLIVGGYTASDPTVTLGGVTLVADVDYFASLRPAASELWITLNRDLTGATNHLVVTPPGTPPPAGLKFYTLTPCRLYDTRHGTGVDAGAPAFSPGETRSPAIAGRCSVPSTAKALSANVTVVTPAASGVLTIYPADLGGAPGTSNISFAPGKTRANNSMLKMAAGGGGIEVFNSSTGSVDVVLDVNGWFE